MYLGFGLISLITQFLIGIAIALPLLAGVYRKKLRELFKRNRKD